MSLHPRDRGARATIEHSYFGFRVAQVSEPGAVCGNGTIEVGEECDDTDTDDGDGCSSTCTVEDGWVCEDEPSVCTPVVCGDGLIEGDEECDDNNTGGGDGCSSTCTVDDGWVCEGEPSVCFSSDVPALSEWGMITMALLGLTAGALVFVRRRRISRVAG